MVALTTVCLSCSDGQACDTVARSPVLVVRMTEAFSASTEPLEGCFDSVCTPLVRPLPSDLSFGGSASFAVFMGLQEGDKVQITLRGSGRTPFEKSTSVVPKAERRGGCKGRVVADVTINASTGELAPSPTKSG